MCSHGKLVRERVKQDRLGEKPSWVQLQVETHTQPDDPRGVLKNELHLRLPHPSVIGYGMGGKAAKDQLLPHLAFPAVRLFCVQEQCAEGHGC